MAIRVYLAGSIALESEERLIRAIDLGTRQSRLLFAYLVCADRRPVPKGELTEVLWGETLPSSWDVSLAALASKLRALLAGVGVRDAIDGALGAYRLLLPQDAWVDVLAAGAEIYRAEGALLRGAPEEAEPHALVAATITRREFLPDEAGAWVEGMRAQLGEQRGRALEILAETLIHAGDTARAVRAAADVLDSDPLRETGYQLLMRAHAASGNRADALRVYERCRRELRDELGIDPSPATERVYLAILRT